MENSTFSIGFNIGYFILWIVALVVVDVVPVGLNHIKIEKVDKQAQADVQAFLQRKLQSCTLQQITTELL